MKMNDHLNHTCIPTSDLRYGNLHCKVCFKALTYREAEEIDSRPRIILTTENNQPARPRCLICNHQVDIYSDTKLCEVCDSSQKDKEIPFPDENKMTDELCDSLIIDVNILKKLITKLRNDLAKEKKLRRKEVKALQKALKRKHNEHIP